MKKFILLGTACLMGPVYAESVEDKVLAVMEELGAAKNSNAWIRRKTTKIQTGINIPWSSLKSTII